MTTDTDSPELNKRETNKNGILHNPLGKDTEFFQILEEFRVLPSGVVKNPLFLLVSSLFGSEEFCVRAHLR